MYRNGPLEGPMMTLTLQKFTDYEAATRQFDQDTATSHDQRLDIQAEYHARVDAAKILSTARMEVYKAEGTSPAFMFLHKAEGHVEKIATALLREGVL